MKILTLCRTLSLVLFAAPVCLLQGLAQPAAPHQTTMPAESMGMPMSHEAAGGQAKAGAKPMPSPPATADTLLNGKTIMVKYNSPSMRGRKIMGDVVPYGKVWRTGANPATGFVTAGDVMIGTLRVPAGSYTLFTLPAAPGTPWMLIVNKQTGQWGLDYHEDQDFGRVPMASAPMSSPQEAMTISFKKKGKGNAVELHVKWETTDEFVTITPAN